MLQTRPGAVAQRVSIISPRRYILVNSKLSHLCRRHNGTANRVPFRKEFKDDRKTARLQRFFDKPGFDESRVDISNWELTVGVEIHAQLNTDRKLFSRASTASEDNPNTNVALFDLALPGSQPEFQKAVLLPALRAALALNCDISRESRFDRKHYFYQDQPAGYQITQYYEPFARNGYLILDSMDDIDIDEDEVLKVGIKQVQLEQDTAKSVQLPPDKVLLDFNRAGLPLIEIITLPQLHDPRTAAICVKKIQSILQSVNAVSTGMELGGLRADVNVSVRPRSVPKGRHSYHGITGLGQRTEIKNLSSFKAVEDAIIVERNRQIRLIEGGGQVEGETRGWTLGSLHTRKLRGKENEVDYRYMPDPDIAPLCIHKDLVDYIKSTLPMVAEEQVQVLINKFGITRKDAKTLVSLDNGERLQYFELVTSIILKLSGEKASLNERSTEPRDIGLLVSNWTLHELGGLLSSFKLPFNANPVQPTALARLLLELKSNKITARSAKTVLTEIFEGDQRGVDEIINQDDLSIRQIDAGALDEAACELVEKHPEMAQKVRDGQKGKFQWFVGQLIRHYGGKIDAQKAAAALKPLLDS